MPIASIRNNILKQGSFSMTNKELRKLNRAQLLEILIEQSKEIDELKSKLNDAQEKLNDRKIKIDKAGSIAQAALEISKIFEDAQKAADLYLENIESDVAKVDNSREMSV
jgi:ABC-type transporter Mla subunit MlaD